ncbi:ABC transporter ATP-binding protein [Cytobacillus gottheilii]|uniref:ABC transporter ATP-binding protein n=1 Tax=Cytobacillus gottheilii TaxID=859144 RepID=A0ABX8FHN5_9BACI|nr:ABC transporter ATP-binding protein [Cytobacillus gottheilii]QVY63537.1 ABC transporter ATP-binding protein [Cytobacillus gottheilii]
MLKLTKQLSAYKWMILAVFALIFIQVLSDLYLPTLMADIIDNGVVVGDTGVIWRIGGLMLAVSALGALASVGASYYASKSAMGFGRDLRRKVFKHVDEFSMQDFDSVGTASLITRTTNDITQIQQVVIMMLRMVVSAPIMFVGGLIMAVSKDAKLSLIILVTMPILAVSIYFIMKKALPLFKLVQDKLDRLNLVMRENLTGIRVIRAFNREKQEKARLQKANRDLTDVSIKVNRIMAFLMPVLMLIMNLTVVAVIWFGGIRIDNGGMQVGDLMAFIQYITQMMFALIMASMMFIMIPRASVSAQRVNEVLEMKPTFVDQGSTQADQDKGTLSFEDVTFHYPGAEEPALSHISFKANPGEVTAIIGGTGAGKSTLVNLIPRFYDITSGVISINGVDVRHASQESVRSKIGLVPQKALLFTGCISENIKYGKEDATEDEVKHAAMVAQAHEFISKMDQGYDTMLAQGGSNLSGGQKQRLSIARALVRKPDVYIFDDSFSALDYKTDKNLRAALKKETKDATVVLVAQRISTVVDADRIIVLDKGRMAGIGTHKELMEENEVYREIVKSQSSEEETA